MELIIFLTFKLHEINLLIKVSWMNYFNMKEVLCRIMSGFVENCLILGSMITHVDYYLFQKITNSSI